MTPEKSNMTWSVLIFGLALLVGAQAQDMSTCQTVYQVLSGDPTLSTAKAAVDAAGLKDVLDAAELEATIFVPNNVAFSTFLKAINATAVDLLAYPDLADLLLYHVVENATRIGSLSQGQLLTSLEGGQFEVLYFEAGDPKYATCGDYHLHLASYGQTAVDPVVCDIEACQSLVHILDYVMVPSSPDLEKAFPRLHVKESLDEEHADHDDHDHDEGHKD